MSRGNHNRALLRAAARIRECLTTSGSKLLPDLPVSAWQELQAAHARLKLAVDRNWSSAAAQLRDELSYTASNLIRRLDECASYRTRHAPTIGYSAHDIYRDLDALHDEFDEVRIDLGEQTLTAVTDSVVLEGLNFGRFEIVLRWSEDEQPYDVIALTPNPPSMDSDITHPHVRDEHLCEGDGELPIRRALEEGRLCDFFLLVRQILDTYNADSAYVQLAHWNGSECHDCGHRMGEDDSTCCERCGTEICLDCSCSCAECGVGSCSECRMLCNDCEMDYCRACLKPCRGCGHDYCPQCLKTGLCLDCRQKENEPNDEIPEVSTIQAAAHKGGEGANQAQAPLQPICLGEALVSA